jgi:hypothetical protein
MVVLLPRQKYYILLWLIAISVSMIWFQLSVGFWVCDDSKPPELFHYGFSIGQASAAGCELYINWQMNCSSWMSVQLFALMWPVMIGTLVGNVRTNTRVWVCVWLAMLVWVLVSIKLELYCLFTWYELAVGLQVKWNSFFCVVTPSVAPVLLGIILRLPKLLREAEYPIAFVLMCVLLVLLLCTLLWYWYW